MRGGIGICSLICRQRRKHHNRVDSRKGILPFTPEKNMYVWESISATFVRIGFFCHFSEFNEVEVSF
jgi:hypothetical protein